MSGSSIAAPPRLLKAYEAFCIPALLLFLVGNLLAAVFPQWPVAHWGVAGPFLLILSGLALASLRDPAKRNTIRFAFWLIALLIGSLHYTQEHFQPSENDVSYWISSDGYWAKPASENTQTEATVDGIIESSPFNHRMIVRVSRINGQVATGRVLADLPYGHPSGKANGKRQAENPQDIERFQAGRHLVISGTLLAPFRSPVPGTFNQQAYLSAQGIATLLKRPESIQFKRLSNDWPYPCLRVTDGLKRRIADTFSRALPSPQSEILGGLVLGDKAIPVDHETKQAFIDTGLIHVLAASGVNVGIIAGAVFWLLARCKVPFRLRLLAAMAAVAFYSVLTGLPPSIQRATAMLELALFLKLLNRELSGVFLLCLASAFLVLLHPDHITSVGFQFSVLTTFGLLTMLAPLQERLGYYITQGVAGLLLAPAVAQIWILPLSIAYFNRFPLHTVPFNIAALALITPLTLLGFTAAVLSLFVPSVALWLMGLTRPLVDALLLLAHWGEGMRWAQWNLASPSAWQLSVMYSALFTFLFLLARLKKRPQHRNFSKRAVLLSVLPLFILLAGLCWEKWDRERHNNLDLLPLSAGREACLIQPAGNQGSFLLLPERLRFGEARTVTDFLRHRQITHVGALILLPDAKSGTSRRQGPNYLKAVLSAVHTDRLLGADESVFPSASTTFNPMPMQTQVFAPSGLDLQLADFHFVGVPQAFCLQAGAFCLLEKGSDKPISQSASPSSCAWHWLAGPQTRFSSPLSNKPIEARDYYRLEQRGEELSVYSENW